MVKFSVAKGVSGGNFVPEKRLAIDAPTPQRASKIIKISEIVEEDGPKPPKGAAKKLSTNAPVKMVIHKYSDCAGDCWESYKTEEDQPLYQCQITHDVARSVCYQFKGE